MATTTDDLRNDTDVAPFGDQAFGDLIATMRVALASLGDRLGLFTALHRQGPLTSDELARVAGVNERYAREWLNGMTCAGYLEVLPGGDRFALPGTHAPVLADEGGPQFVGGALQQIPAAIGAFDHLVDAFRNGGGVHQAHYHPDFWEGMQRDTAGIFNASLVQEWIPAMPDVQHALESGTTVADIGCGSGLALIRLAQAYPRSRFTGIDNFPSQIERANANVAEAGLQDRVTVRLADGSNGIGGPFGIVTSFDVVHDAAHPADLLRSIRAGLEPGGIYVMAEPNAGETLAENLGPIGTYLYTASLLYCMTTSLAVGGEGLGMAGLPESRVRALAADAGFASVRRIDVSHPLYALYEIRA